MTTPSHMLTGMAIGIVLVNVNENTEPLSPSMIVSLCILFSNILDINIIWKRPLIKHHEDITHYPIFSLILSMVAFIIDLIFFPYTTIFIQMVGICLMLHILMDTFGNSCGIHWFWPISNKEYSFTQLKKYNPSTTSTKQKISMFRRSLIMEIIYWIIMSIFIMYTFIRRWI